MATVDPIANSWFDDFARGQIVATLVIEAKLCETRQHWRLAMVHWGYASHLLYEKENKTEKEIAWSEEYSCRAHLCEVHSHLPTALN